MNLKRYAKFFVAAAAALAVLATALADGTITGDEWRAVGAAVLGALGVRQIPNAPGGDVPPPRV